MTGRKASNSCSGEREVRSASCCSSCAEESENKHRRTAKKGGPLLHLITVETTLATFNFNNLISFRLHRLNSHVESLLFLICCVWLLVYHRLCYLFSLASVVLLLDFLNPATYYMVTFFLKNKGQAETMDCKYILISSAVVEPNK